jgi:enamine deaminase RidA (YjgF/YER057c/UK114 family)
MGFRTDNRKARHMIKERSTVFGGPRFSGEVRSSSACRRFRGPLAKEVFLLACPVHGRAGGLLGEALSIYRQLAETVRAEGGSAAQVVQETVYFRSIRDGLPALLEAKRQAWKGMDGAAQQPASTFIEQPPLDPSLNIIACFSVLVPHHPASLFAWSLRGASPCSCEACLETSSALAYFLGGTKYLVAGNIYGAPGRAFDETSSMFRTAGDLLRQEGMTFKDVCRTWIYLRDMDRCYGDFNLARRAFFQREGVGLPPASTGIEGAPFPEDHNFSLAFCAIKPPRPVPVAPMTTPTLNEAWTYGSDFSRGLRVLEPNRLTLHVSGTASIDDQGQTAHRGDFDGQVERMVLNVSTLLAEQGATLDDLVSATTYLRRPQDAGRLQQVFERCRVPEFPNALVSAAVCRPELLCEMEAVALLPRPPGNGSGELLREAPEPSG